MAETESQGGVGWGKCGMYEGTEPMGEGPAWEVGCLQAVRNGVGVVGSGQGRVRVLAYGQRQGYGV